MPSLPLIADETVTQTLEALNSASSEEVLALQKRSGRFQPELTGLAIAFSMEQRPEAAGVGLFVMIVLYELFQRSRVKVKKARERVVLRHWRAAREQAAALQVDVDDPLELLDDLPDSSEPIALQYVIEALTEETDDKVQLTVDEFWRLYVVAVTMIETLHEMATK